MYQMQKDSKCLIFITMSHCTGTQYSLLYCQISSRWCHWLSMLCTKSMSYWSLMWSKYFSTCLLFIRKIWAQSDIYHYAFKASYHNETLAHCHFSFHTHDCWPMLSLTSCLSDSSPVSITLKVAHYNSMCVPRYRCLSTSLSNWEAV